MPIHGNIIGNKFISAEGKMPTKKCSVILPIPKFLKFYPLQVLCEISYLVFYYVSMYHHTGNITSIITICKSAAHGVHAIKCICMLCNRSDCICCCIIIPTLVKNETQCTLHVLIWGRVLGARPSEHACSVHARVYYLPTVCKWCNRNLVSHPS